MHAEEKAEFKLDFVGGWTKARYVKAQASLDEYERRYPLYMPLPSYAQRRAEAARLHTALAAIGLSADMAKLASIGVRKRTMLAVVELADIEMLGLAGTLAQYRSVAEPALEECELPSPICNKRAICMDELFERLVGVKQMRDMAEESGSKKQKLEHEV